jgi:hypothetical protein
MFQQWSNIYIRLYDFLPSFVKLNNNERYIPNIIFMILLIFLVVLSLKKMNKMRLKFFFPLCFVALTAIVALFPRIPLHNPVLVQNNSAIPHLFHGKSMYPIKTVQKTFNIKQSGLSRYLISTRKKVPFFAVNLTNTGLADLGLELYIYDKSVKKISVAPGQQSRIFLKDPRSKKMFSRFFYQFSLKVKKTNSNKILLNIELFPSRREL